MHYLVATTRLVRLLGIALLLCLAVSAASAQQEPVAPAGTASAIQDRPQWEGVADWAEQLLESGAASERSLDLIRASLVDQRAKALEVVSRGSVAVRALEAQLAALGPAPADGQVEAEAVAAMRAALVENLARANAPVLAAQQAYERSEVLIKEVDRVLRRRDMDALFVRRPTPLDPSVWLSALPEIAVSVQSAGSAVAQSFMSPERAEGAVSQLALAAALVAGGLLLGFGLHPFLSRFLLVRLQLGGSVRAQSIWLLLSHVERIVIPLIAGASVVGGVTGSGLIASLEELETVLILAPLILALANGLAHLVFSPNYPQAQLLAVNAKLAVLGVRLCQGLGLVLIGIALIESFDLSRSASEATLVALSVLAVLPGAALLWWLGGVLRSNLVEGPDGETSEASFGTSLSTPLSLLVRLAALVAAVAVLVGYADLARQVTSAAIMSLGAIATLMTLYRVILSVPTIATGAELSRENAIGAIVPLALGTALTLLALPLLALIWGARATDISELWVLAVQGVDFGGVRLSLSSAALLVVVFAFGLFATNWIQAVVRTNVLPRTRTDPGVGNAIVTFVGYFGVLMATLFAAGAAGINLSNLAIVAGALSVGIGFGLQSIVANFLSGLILLVERPVKEGDWIEVAGFSGTVRKIAIRSTRIETFDRHDVILPNSEMISSAVKNMTLGSKVGRVTVPVGVAYGTDAEKVRAILLELAKAHPLTLQRPEPVVLLRSLGDNALQFELRCFIRDVMETISVKSDLLLATYSAFEAHDIAIPFPQRDIHVHLADKTIAEAIQLAETKRAR